MKRKRTTGSTQGWSTEDSREALVEVRAHLMVQFDLTKTEAVQLMAGATGSSVQTVQGWLSEGESRRPPSFAFIDVLRYRTGLAKPEPLIPKKGPG